jgi:hypothetical protein
MTLGVGAVVRVSAEMADPIGGLIMNTFDVKIDTQGTGGNTDFREDVRDYIDNMYGTIYTGLQTGTTYDRVSFYHRNGTEAIIPITWNGPGEPAGAGDALPAGTAALVYARTETRRAVARKFLGPFTEVNSAGFGPVAGLQTALTGFVDEWLDPWSGANGWDFHAVLWHNETSALEFTEGGFSLNWAIQRRRREGRGA